MPQSDIVTGINPIDTLAIQKDTQARLNDVFGGTQNYAPPGGFEVPKGIGGTVEPGQNINLDKNSVEYQQAFNQKLDQDLTKQYPDTFNRLPDLRLPQSDTRRFINQDFGFKVDRDNEDFYNTRQNAGWEFFGKSLFARLPLLTLTKLGTGIGYLAGLADPTNWFDKNYISAASDNFIAKAFTGLEDKVKNDWLPIYQKASAKDMGFFDRAIHDQTFWSGDVVDAAAFMASAYVPASIFSKLKLGTKLLTGLGATADEALTSSGTFLQKMGQGVINHSDEALTTLVNTASESMFEARQIKDDLTQKLKNTGKYTEGEINDMVGDKMRNSFISNLAALSFSNAWESNLFFKALNRNKSLPVGAIKLGESSLLEEYGLPKITTKVGKFLETPLGFYGKKALQGMAVEGFYEENIQQAIQQYNEKNAEGKPDSLMGYTTGVIKQMYHQTIDALQGKDKDTAMNIGVGALIGGLFGTSMSAISGEHKEERKAAETALAALNATRNNWLKVGDIYSVDENGKVKTDNAKAAAVFINQAMQTDQLNQVRDKIDPITMELGKKQLFAKLAAAHIENGSLDILIKQLTELKSSKVEDQIKFGFDPDENTLSKIEEYKDYASKLKDLRESVNKIHPTKGDPNGFINYYRNNLYDIAASKIASEYEINHLSNKMADLSHKIGYTDGTDGLVEQLNNLKLKQTIQQANIDSAPAEHKEIYEKRLNKYEKQYAELDKANESTIDELRSDKDGYYAYKNQDKNDAPLMKEHIEAFMKRAMLENQTDILNDQYSDLFNNREKSKNTYNDLTESFVKFAEDLKKNKEQETKQTTQPNGTTQTTTGPAAGTATTPAGTVPNAKQEKLDKLLELNKQREQEKTTAKENGATDADIAAINNKYNQLAKEINYGAEVGLPHPVDNRQKFEELLNLIPKGKSINRDDLIELHSQIANAMGRNEITPEQEANLHLLLDSKEVTGTMFDRDDEVPENETTEETDNKEDNVTSQDVSKDPTTDEDPQLGQDTNDYDPNNVDVEDPVTDIKTADISLMAYRTSNKTVTQEEEQPGKLDEDPYKQFKQNFLRGLAENPENLKLYSGKIIKDNESLPHSEDTKANLRAGVYGSVLVVTDRFGNDVYFDAQYNPFSDPGEGRQQMVFSFTRDYWTPDELARASIGELRTGIPFENFIEMYAEEGQQQESARELNDKGKEVVVDLGDVVPGVLATGSTYTNTLAVITPDMNASLMITPPPPEKFDPANPKANLFVAVGNQRLINGGLYASIKDPNSGMVNYIRLIPNKISDNPELLKSISDLMYNHYTDEHEATQARDYLKEILFLGKPNRPTLQITGTDKGFELTMIDKGVAIPTSASLDFLIDQRFNVIKRFINNPSEYDYYDVKDGKLDYQQRENYTDFILNNTKTRFLPLKTKDGKRFVAINSYMTFTFRDSSDTMKSELVTGDVAKAGERAIEFKQDEVPVFAAPLSNDISLNEASKQDAQDAGDFWKRHGIDGKVISSSVPLAMEYARTAATTAGIKDVQADDTIRPWDIGDYKGQEFDEKYWVVNSDKVIPGGESFDQFAERTIKAQQRLSKVLTPKDTVVAHSSNIRLWDAIKLNNGLYNDVAKEIYLGLSPNYAFTSLSKAQTESDGSTLTKPSLRRIDLEDEEGLKAIRTTENRPTITSEEVDKVNRIFGKQIAELVNKISNSDAAALWTISGIRLYRDAKQGDGYHEAWHHFSQIYLNGNQKRSLYDEIRKKNIRFNTRDGRRMSSSSASDFDLEEFVADDFRDYVLSNGRSRLVDRPHRNTLFRKILDFIKSFFFGEVNISKLYDDLYKGNLYKYDPSINNAYWGKLNAQTLNQKGEEIFDAQKSAYYRDVLDYMMGKHLRIQNYDPQDLRKDKTKAESIYKNMRSDLVANYYHPLLDKEDNGTITPHERTVAEDLYNLLYNYEDFIQFHKKNSKLFLNIPHELVIDTLDQSEELDTELGGEDYEIKELDESETEPLDDEVSTISEYGRAGNELSSWQAASMATRSLIRMLPAIDPITKKEVLDPNGFPRLNDYAKTWNNLAYELANMTEYGEMYNKMTNAAVQNKIPELIVLLQHLPDPNKTHTPSEVDMILNFRRDFNRAYIGIFSGKTAINGNFYMNEETKRNQDLIKKLWTANFYNKTSTDINIRNERILVDNETSKNYLNPEVTLTYALNTPQGREDLLSLIGFNFTEEAKQNPFYRNNISQTLFNIQKNINDRHLANQKIFNPIYDLRIDLKNEKGEVLVPGLAQTLDSLVLLESRYNNVVPSMSYRTAEGTMIYGLSLNHTLSIISNKLNKATKYEDIVNDPAMQHLNVSNNPYVRGSLFLQGLFDLRDPNSPTYGVRTGRNVIVGNYNGPKYEDEDGQTTGYSTTSLNIRQKAIFDMNSFLSSGAIEIMRTESSKSAYFVKLNFYSTSADKSREYLPVGTSEFGSSFRSPTFMRRMIDNYLRDELDRMKNADSVEVYKTDPKLLNSAKGFNLFSDILKNKVPEGEKGNTEALKNSIKADIEKMSPEEVIEKHRKDIEDAIELFFNGQYNKFVTSLSNNNITADDLAKNLLPGTTYPQKLRTFLANDFIMNVEYTKVFNGDTVYQSQYNDYFKRSKGDISTGETPMTDDLFARHMKRGEINTFAGFIKSTYVNDYKTVQTINIKDDIRSSKYIDIWKQDLKKTNPEMTDADVDKLLKKYKELNIGDGQGHITLDFYRQFLKSISNWSDDQEKQYQLELAQYRLAHADFNEDYTNEMRQRDRTFLEENPDVYAYFPPIKMQYNGPIKAKGTFAPVMDKFSVAPLIPSLIAGRPLEDLNYQMLKKGVGYAKFISGTKKYKHPPIEMYNEEGYKTIDLTDHQPAVHFLTYHKEQINTKDAVKEESIFGSQIRKLIEANTFDKGNATEVDVSRHNKYLQILNNLKQLGKRDLYNDLGIEEIPSTTPGTLSRLRVKDIRAFVSTIQQQADLRELNDNIKNYIQVADRSNTVLNSETSYGLMYPLETSLNRRDIQNLLMGVIDKRLRIQKLNGDQLFQISSSGFQSKDFKYTNATEAEIKEFGTNGLRFYRIGEDGKTLPAQVKLGLNGDFVNLLNLTHTDGNRVANIKRLNSLLKDENWMKDNRHLVTIIGYRIPTQGHNSMEFMEVAEFLPAHVGSSVIVPAEIVAKSGSDFDIDKLSVFRPSIDEQGRLITGDSKDSYGNQIIDLFKEILSDPKNFKQLIKPNDTELIHSTVDDVAVALGRREKEDIKDPKPYQRTQIYRYSNNLRKFESLLSAQRLLGVFAVSNTFTTLLQQAGIKTNGSYKITRGPTRLVKLFLLSPQERELVITDVVRDSKGKITSYKIDISNKYDVEGNLKQDYTNQLINATVDAASDDFFGYSSISYENIGVLGLLMNQGVPFDRAFWFLHSPVLMKYYEELRQRKQGESKAMIQARILGTLLNKDFTYVREDTGQVALNRDQFNDTVNTLLNDPKVQNVFLSTDILKKNTAKVWEVGDYLANERNTRLSALQLAYFISLQEQSNLFRDFQKILNFDTVKTPSPVYSYQAYKAIDQIKANRYLTPEDVQAMSTKTTISSFDNKLLIAQLGNTLMPAAFNNVFMKKAATKITNDTKFKNKAFTKKYITNYENQWMEYIVKSIGQVDGKSMRSYSKSLLEGKNSIARRFNELTNKYPQLKADYNFVDRIKPNFPNNKKVTKSNLEVYRLFENNQDDQNKYIQEFRNLINFSDPRYSPEQQLEIRKFFKDLAIAAFLQSGFSRSNISFQELVPYEELADVFKNALTNFQRLIVSDPDLLDRYISEFNAQFSAFQKRGIQTWRGNDYYLSSPVGKAITDKLNAEEVAKTQVNTETEAPAPKELPPSDSDQTSSQEVTDEADDTDNDTNGDPIGTNPVEKTFKQAMAAFDAKFKDFNFEEDDLSDMSMDLDKKLRNFTRDKITAKNVLNFYHTYDFESGEEDGRPYDEREQFEEFLKEKGLYRWRDHDPNQTSLFPLTDEEYKELLKNCKG